MSHKWWFINVTQLVYFTLMPLCDTIVTLWYASCDRCDIDESHFSEFSLKIFRFFFFKNFESVKISVFVVWSECQFNVKNVYFEKSKFSTKIWNFDTKKNFKKFVYQHQINNLQLNFNLELTHVCVITNYKITFSENRFSNIHIHFSVKMRKSLDVDLIQKNSWSISKNCQMKI